jgi:hypothetical protein
MPFLTNNDLQMSEQPWIPLKSDGRRDGRFCRILRECLEEAGVEVDMVCYEGKTMGPLDQSSTFLTLTVPEDPRVPDFKKVEVHSRAPPWRCTKFVHVGH